MSPTPQTTNVLKFMHALESGEPWKLLYEVEVPTDPPTRLRFVKGSPQATTETFRGNAYYPFPVTHASERVDTEGNLQETTLTVANVSREIVTLLEEHGGLVGQPVRIILIHNTELVAGNGQPSLETDYRIASTTYNEDAVTSRLANHNAYRTNFPALRLMRRTCRWTVYRGQECGYAVPVASGGLLTCDFSLSGPNGCQVHGANELANGFTVRHPARFGGAPGIPRQPTGGKL